MKHLRFVFLLSVINRIIISSLIVEKKISDTVLGLSEIINGLKPTCLSIYTSIEHYDDIVDDFIFQIHKIHIKTCIFYEKSKFLKYIENSITASIESNSLIFTEPYELIKEIQNRNLAHRLCLFMFYWNAKYPPSSKTIRFKEPMRVVMITKPRKKALRVYYNQAVPTGKGHLHLVNWYDAESVGLYKTPLLPNAAEVYSNFQGRILYVPVIHSPPWFFINNDNNKNATIKSTVSNYSKVNDDNNGAANDDDGDGDIDNNYDEDNDDDDEYSNSLEVIGGRDHYLLNLLGEKMNFNFQYIDPDERTQGTSIGNNEDNISFSGGIGMIQRKEAQLLLGDVGLSWERRKAVEFSFFTLADSGAFATHAPKRLNEALALFRPFKINVWPFVILTILLSGPALYFIIIIPQLWKFNTKNSKFIIYPEYIMEITYHRSKRKTKSKIIQDIFLEQNVDKLKLFGKCIWFTIHIFLNQSCSELYQNFRVRFLLIIYWIAATNILAAIYSAQLTSLFAKPAREGPIDTLQKLEYALKYRNYKLYIEKDSSSLELLENSTEIFRRLYMLMLRQGENGYFIDSVEQGINFISDGSHKVILAGRETLYYNIKKCGLQNFQLSYKLYARYSAIAVQIGCPFLDSLNNVLMQLFESGLLDKITNIEYNKQKNQNYMPNNGDNNKNNDKNDIEIENIEKEENDQQKQINKMKDVKTEPINLRMIQGAFIILIVGFFIAMLILCFELIYSYHNQTNSDSKKIVQKF